MPNQQFARGIFAQFGTIENPFQSPNGMEENLRLIDDHIGPYTLNGPVAPDEPYPEDAANGDGQIYTDGTYAIYNGSAWKRYPAFKGITFVELNGSIWTNTGTSWRVPVIAPVSPKQFGAKGDGVTYDDDALDLWCAYLLASGRSGYLDAGVYKRRTPWVIDLSSASPKGLKIFGDGQQTSFIDVNDVTTSPAILITALPDSDGAGFYSSFRDFAIRGNMPGTLLMLGPADNSAALNAIEFSNLWVGNHSTSGDANAIQVNYVLGSKFDNVVAANNHGGDAWRLCAAAFCTWIGGAGTWAQRGMHLMFNESPYGTIAGNLFIGIDFEENVESNIKIDTPNAHNNEWRGGTHVYVPGMTHAVDALQGYSNVISNPSINTGAVQATFANFFANHVGVAVQGVAGLFYGNGPGNPTFNAYMSAAQAPTPATWSKINFNTIDFQNGNSYAPSNQRFTCQVPGVYDFSVLIRVTATNSSLATHQLSLYRNGGEMRTCVQNVAAGTNTITIQLTAQCVLSVGDYVEAYANLAATSGAPSIGGGNAASYLSGALRSI
ncbi:hypothetical protein [Burkholderia sp. BCC0397]|uniref:C1q-like domain-containing protein n=1 Tax=Burkholderia sp. BCC0397 TaxID=486876 RepID=UPI00158C842A|nr:hypothetical protein [Burkholderia sp. BCC0397]